MYFIIFSILRLCAILTLQSEKNSLEIDSLFCFDNLVPNVMESQLCYQSI